MYWMKLIAVNRKCDIYIYPFLRIDLHMQPRYNDSFENELSRELENGRLVRLLIKMGFINERPE